MNFFVLLSATGLGAGFSPIVPGTMGTLLAIPIYYFISSISSPLYELTLVAFFFFSSWISNQAEQYWGKKDDRRIVIDELMGFHHNALDTQVASLHRCRIHLFAF
jgi:phosphatidylglycerophosphatase A